MRFPAGEELLALSRGKIRQPVRFLVVLSSHVRDGELQAARQFAASPVQGIESRAAARVNPVHLFDDHFRIGVNVQFAGLMQNGALQGFQ